MRLVTCTPILNKRQLDNSVPLSPFLTTNTIDKTVSTPMMAGAILIQAAGTKRVGGVEIG